MSGARFTEGMDFQADWDTPHAAGGYGRIWNTAMSTGTHPPAGINGIPASFWITTVIISSATIRRSDGEGKHQRQQDVRRGHRRMATAGRLAGQLRPSLTMTRTLPPSHDRRLEPLLRLSTAPTLGAGNLRWAAYLSPVFSTALALYIGASVVSPTIRCCRRNCAACAGSRGHCAFHQRKVQRKSPRRGAYCMKRRCPGTVPYSGSQPVRFRCVASRRKSRTVQTGEF